MNSNTQYTKYVGYDDSFMPTVGSLFDGSTFRFIQTMVYDMSKAYFPQGVLVPCEVIANVLSTVFANFVPPTGDIHSRYTIPVDDMANNDYVSNIISQTARIVLDDVVNTLGTERNNQSLDIWTTVLGDFNSHGLRSHDQLKTRENKPPSALFFENY